MSEIEASGVPKGRLPAVQLDVTDSSSIQQAASVVQHKFARLDVLINNAGVYSDIFSLIMPRDAKSRFSA